MLAPPCIRNALLIPEKNISYRTQCHSRIKHLVKIETTGADTSYIVKRNLRINLFNCFPENTFITQNGRPTDVPKRLQYLISLS